MEDDQTPPGWRRGRAWQHRHTIWHMLANFRSFRAAKRHFDSRRAAE